METLPKIIDIKDVDKVPKSGTATQVHDLLLESVGKIADEWVAQLKVVRENTQTLEAQILAYVGKTKADISALHELGVKVAAEAARGQEVCRQLRDGLEKIS